MKNILQALLKNEYGIIGYKAHPNIKMPNVEEIERCMEYIRALIYPGYFCNTEPWTREWEDEMNYKFEYVVRVLRENIFRALCFQCDVSSGLKCSHCEEKAETIVKRFIDKLPEIKRILYLDVKAAFEYDPAAKSIDEVILCYPGIKAITYHRIAHVLYEENVPVIPRIISEIVHSQTGIDIHPGAVIGNRFFIDHGTGVVIGETSQVGNNVRIYQGVTLGARSFQLDNDGRPIKGIPRHPIVEDDVIIYAGATILGRVRIGRGSIIGSNVTVTTDVPPGSKIVQRI